MSSCVFRVRAGVDLKPLAGFPDLLRGPSSGPFAREEVEAIGRHVGRRLELNQGFDFEAVRAQESDTVAVAEVEVDGIVAFPLKAVHTEVGPEQTIAGRDDLVFVWVAKVAQGTTDEE